MVSPYSKFTVGRIKFPRQIKRESRRKYARTLVRFLAQLRGFFWGLLTVLFLWGAFVHSSYAQSTNANCGGLNQPTCSVTLSDDSVTDAAASSAEANISGQITNLQSTVSDANVPKFTWSFIPQIPTAQCTNPLVANPISGFSISIDVCTSFNIFQAFFNCVLAVFCVYGCVDLVSKAMKA